VAVVGIFDEKYFGKVRPEILLNEVYQEGLGPETNALFRRINT